MSFGPVTLATLKTFDVQAPGGPGVNVSQVSNSRADYLITPPIVDADGSPLTGLTYAEAAILEASAEEAQAYANDFEAALAVPGAQVFNLDMTPTSPPVSGSFVVQENRSYAVLVRCADHPREQ
jgi:hypothetical protein